MTAFQPAYIETHRKGILRKKIDAACDCLTACQLCPRKCEADRLNPDMLGVCKTGKKAWVSSFHQHFGEEAPLVGRYGSGTIFFTHCNLLCSFCQNFDISHEGVGESVTDGQLAAMMLDLQNSGCHNINFVSPSHVVPQILFALEIAIKKGLTVPLIYNSGGYDRVETLKLLDGIVDIYTPDFKFWNPETAEITCAAPDYPEVARRALLEMHRQVGDLTLDDNGLAQRGLLVRHLVMPEGLAGTRYVMRFIASRISTNTYVNIMPQYRPCGYPSEIKELSRRINNDEFHTALLAARKEGITRLDKPRHVFTD